MAKRMHEQKEEEIIVAKSRLTVMTLVSSVHTSSSSVDSPIASRSPGMLKANTSQNSNPHEVSSPQGWQRDAQLFISRGGFVATEQDQKSLNRHEKSIKSTGELVATGYQGCREKPETPEDSEDLELESRIWPHHFSFSPDNYNHTKSTIFQESTLEVCEAIISDN